MKLADIRPLPEWYGIDAGALGATVLILGATDSGKSTLVHWLAARLAEVRRPVAWIDGDVGQSTLGVPTTMNLALCREPPVEPPLPAAVFFVGGISPRGHMLPALVGSERLRQRAVAAGVLATLIDTSGLVAEAAGGGALQEWAVELLRPSAVLALQREDELEHLLGPLRRRSEIRLYLLPVTTAVRRRSPEERAARRRRQYREYFSAARPQVLPLHGLPVYGQKKAAPHRLLACLDRDGFALALGLLLDYAGGRMEILTPLPQAAPVAALRFGDLRVDPETGEETS